jgi:hypothetical protein
MACPLTWVKYLTGRSPIRTRSARRRVLASALVGDPELNGGWGSYSIAS